MEINSLDINLLIEVVKKATNITEDDKSRLIKSLKTVDGVKDKKKETKRNENSVSKEAKTRGKITKAGSANIKAVAKRRKTSKIHSIVKHGKSDEVEVIDNGKKVAFGKVFGTNKDGKEVAGPFDTMFISRGPKNAANRLARAYPEFLSKWIDFVNALTNAKISFDIRQQELFLIDNYTYKHNLTYGHDRFEVSDEAYENLLDAMQSRLDDLDN